MNQYILLGLMIFVGTIILVQLVSCSVMILQSCSELDLGGFILKLVLGIIILMSASITIPLELWLYNLSGGII